MAWGNSWRFRFRNVYTWFGRHRWLAGLSISFDAVSSFIDVDVQIVVGEETGRLDSCLEKISERMDNEIPRRIKRLFGVLEPLIILTLLGIVGLVAAAIFLPLFSLMSGIG